MRNLTKMIAVGLLASSALVSAPAFATVVPDGTVTVAALYSPTVNLASSPATYTVAFGNTFEITGSGGFADASGLFGQMNGTLSFSSTVGETVAPQSLANFFVFDDGHGGTYNFSVDSVLTKTYSANAGISNSFSLYLLGTTLDTLQGYAATPTSLTLSFNNTGSSGYAASATLAVPPSDTGSVPEPVSWALMVGGFGMVGATMRSNRRAAVSFA
jgi:hypothetical protein